MGCRPILVDDVPVAPRVDGLDVLTTGSGGLDALLGCEVVVKSPGISRYRPEVAHLEAAGVAVCGGLGLFMAEADPARVACITGTKGKAQQRRWPSTCSPASATAPAPAGTSASHPGIPRPSRALTTG